MTIAPISAAGARRRLTDGVLAWLTANIDAFDPPQEDDLIDLAPEQVMPGSRRKAFGELGLALRLCHRVPALREHGDVRGMTSWWLATAARRQIFFDARRRVHLVPLMAVALAVQATFGCPDEAARAALQRVLDRRFLDRTERSAWTQTDIAYYLDALGLRHALPKPATLFRRSSLLDLPAVPHALRIDFYATTHLIFHLSDFGARDIAGASAAELAGVRGYVSLALATCIAERDWDLVGELLAARVCLGEADDALADASLEALAEAQQPGGFMPDLAWVRSRDAAASQTEPGAARFEDVYHPTLVVLIMLACGSAERAIGVGAAA